MKNKEEAKRNKSRFKMTSAYQKISSFFIKPQRDKLVKSSTSSEKTIVFFNKYIPEFDKGSGANRFNQITEELVNLGYKVYLISKRGQQASYYSEYYQNKGITVFCCQNSAVGYKKFLKHSLSSIDIAWFYGPNSFKTYGNRFLFKNYASAKFVYDMIDIHHLRFQRALDLDPNDKKLKKQIKKYAKLELKAANKSDYVLAISEKEKQYMTSFVSPSKIKVVSNIHAPKLTSTEITPFSDRKDIVFIGSGHQPNIDALQYLNSDIMPIVWDQHPNIKVHIIGKVKNEVNFELDDRFILHGFVKDITSLFSNAKIMVVPLRYGAGVKGKLGQAFEYGLPVVSTRIGSEGMFLKNKEHLLKADNAKDFAEAILKLYNEQALWDKFSQKSFDNLKPFGKKQVADLINEI